MKPYSFLIILTILVSCVPSNKKRNLDSKEKYDSIQIYYDRSIGKDISITEKSESIDRAIYLAKDLKNDSIKGNLLYQKSSLLFQAGEYDSLLLHHRNFINTAARINWPRIQASQYYLMGYYHDRVESDYKKAFENYSAAKNQFELAKDSSWVGKTLLNMATIQKDQNDFFGSKETVTEAIAFLNATEHKDELVQCYNLLATNHRKLLNLKDAIAYYKKAIANSVNAKDKIAFENNLGATLVDDGKYEKAIAIFERLLKDSSLDSSTARYARILDNLSYTKWLVGQEINADSFQKALAIRIKEGDMRGQMASYAHLGEFHMKNNPSRAMAYFDSVIQVSKRMDIPRAETDALRFMMQLQPNNVKLHQRYVHLQDSLYKEELSVETQFAKYKYDDKLKQESILRLEKEKAEQALLTARERNKKTLSYLGTILLLLALSFAIYYFGQRTKRLKERNKLAKLEATLETEAEMSRRLHDDFGAGLNQTMLMLQSDADKSTVLDKLDALYSQSRNFSREINEVGTGGRFKDEFLEMLHFRTPKNANLFITGIKDIQWDEMAPLYQQVLFKILQELMINMARHSHAKMVTLGFKRTGKTLAVKYSDNGVGASLEELNAKNGLRNTEKRIQAIGGSIIFDTGKGEGFTVRVTIPF